MKVIWIGRQVTIRVERVVDTIDNDWEPTPEFLRALGIRGWPIEICSYEVYTQQRMNGEHCDTNGLRFEPPWDGKLAIVRGVEKRGKIYGVRNDSGKYEYETQYRYGRKDKKWFCRVDCNYLTRILRAGHLKAKEPAVWALRELDRSQGKRVDNIAAWWRTKVFLPNISTLLEAAEAEYSAVLGGLLEQGLTQHLPHENREFERGLFNIVKEYLGLRVIRPEAKRTARPRLNASRIPPGGEGKFSREYYEKKDRETAEATAKSETEPTSTTKSGGLSCILM